MIEFAVEIDGEFVYTLRADGLIVATPTGSTAYALSAQGPILHPSVQAIALVPLTPHALSTRPIAVSDSTSIKIKLKRASDAAAHFDGRRSPPSRKATRWPSGARRIRSGCLHPEGYEHFAMLREKLHWGATPERLGARRAKPED